MPDYMSDMDKMEGTPEQAVPAEPGNNGGQVANDSQELGDIHIKGTPDFMGGTADAAGK